MIVWSRVEIMRLVETCQRHPEHGAWQIERAITLASEGALKADWHGKGVLEEWADKEKSDQGRVA